MLGYIGPETMIPLASVLAAAGGIVLIFWRYVVLVIRRIFRTIFRLGRKGAKAQTYVADQSETEKPES